MQNQQDSIRKHYIDNLRNLTILLLFPVHTFMIWNDFGSRFYVWQGENKILSTLIVLVNPWFMPILFVLAGMSARYALDKRTNKEFIMQRINKLFIPFISGMVILVPFQTLYARKFFNNYDGSLPGNWLYFFTHLTDFSGYDGAFTPGHLWFILFLFIISMITLVLFYFVPYEKVSGSMEKMPAFGVLLLFIPVWLMYYLGNFGGFSIGKNLALYLIGYYVLSNDLIMNKLEKSIRWMLCLCVIGTIVSVAMYYKFSYYGDLWVNFIGWVSILVLLVAGKKFLNERTCFTEYFNRASYPIYILHQSILVALAYYIVQVSDILSVQVSGICIGSFVLTVLAYHLIRLVPGVRRMIGIS
ncbi:MAG: acyltransferase [Lachnospiraceae bacterium]|nr:acyltransferase [Lachnospiraceae bacterium]